MKRETYLESSKHLFTQYNYYVHVYSMPKH